MRKHSPRKWLHAILDLVPVLIIGVFALYTTNKNATFEQSVSVENDIYQDVDFNQLFQNQGFFNNGYGTLSVDGNLLKNVTPSTTNNGAWRLQYNIVLDDHIYYLKYDYFCDYGTLNLLSTNNSSLLNYYTQPSITYSGNTRFNGRYIDRFYFYYDRSQQLSSNVDVYFKNVQLFDLTQMFGAGNEPSIQDFNNIFTDDYYEYTLSTPMTIKVGTESVTYSDTDVGSQMVYTLYKTTEKYFNMNQVFNLQDVYTWVSINLFGGNPPLMASVVWNIIVYEFIIDLLFLFYAFFMFIIDFIEYLLDKPFSKARGK